jgi:glycerol uptake facilitator-like aquaporin
MTRLLPLSRRVAAPLPSLGRACAAELVGTFIPALFGCGSAMSAVIAGAQVGPWQVAVVYEETPA